MSARRFGIPAAAVLAGGISRHGGRCLCWACRPTDAEIQERLALAVAGDDIAMIARCRAALTGDRQALGSLYASLEMERSMGGVR